MLPARARRLEAQLLTHLTLLTVGCATNCVPPVPAPTAAGAIARAPPAAATPIRFACLEERILDGTSYASLSRAYGVS
jgi:hypothetical protein